MNNYSFAQLEVGLQEVLKVEITENDIDAYARFSGDCSSIHLENDYAKSRGFKTRLSHGLLVSAYVSALIGMKLPGMHGLLQSINCQFRAPCYAPNELKIVGTIIKRFDAIKEQYTRWSE